MRLEPDVTADEIEHSLRLLATDRFGEQRAAELQPRLAQYARMLVRVAREPVDFATDPPDRSGVAEGDDDV